MTDSLSSTRLNKHLALSLGVSRREADMLIEQGKITLNGGVAILGAHYHEGDTILISGEPPKDEFSTFIYLAFNKPTGYVCSRRAQGENPTIYALLPEKYHHLKPVGRLDRNSTGLLILTNDGDFAYQMTHPKFYKTKVYEARLDHDLAPLHQQMISEYGIQLEDGPSKLSLMRMSEENRQEWQVTMTEGRNRQIRRTFTALGYMVTDLHRTQFGSYSLGDISTGEYKEITIS